MDDRKHAVRAHSRLDEALALLDPQSREVVTLWLEGKDDGVVAARLGLAEPVVVALRGRAVAVVRDSIARRRPPEARGTPAG